MFHLLVAPRQVVSVLYRLFVELTILNVYVHLHIYESRGFCFAPKLLQATRTEKRFCTGR